MNKKKHLLKYFTASIILALIANVYYLFGQEVRSLYMDFAFVIPAVGGFATLLMREMLPRLLVNYSMWTFVAYCLLRGTFESLETTSKYTEWFLATANYLLIGSIIVSIYLFIAARMKKPQSEDNTTESE